MDVQIIFIECILKERPARTPTKEFIDTFDVSQLCINMANQQLNDAYTNMSEMIMIKTS